MQWHCLLDNDDDGRAAYKAVLDEGIAQSRNCTLTLLGRKKQSELEDWYLEGCYRAAVTGTYGDLLAGDEYRKTRGKWAVRMRAAMEASGQPWTTNEFKLKDLVAGQVAAAPEGALKSDAKTVLASLVGVLESHLG